MWLRRSHLATGVSVGSAHSIVTSVFNLYPYSIQIRHHLKWTDFNKRIKLAEWFLEDPIIARFFTPTDEAYFNLDGNVNNYKFRILLLLEFRIYLSTRSKNCTKVTTFNKIGQQRIVLKLSNLSSRSNLGASLIKRTSGHLVDPI